MGSGSPQGCEKRSRLEKKVISVLLEGTNTKYSLVFRETKGPFPWPRCCRKVGANTVTPGTHSGHEEPDKTHPVFCHHHGHALLIPTTLHLDICTPLASSIRGCIEGAIACHIRGIVEGAIACHIRGIVEGAITCHIRGIVPRTVGCPIDGTLFIPAFFARSITCRTRSRWKWVRWRWQHSGFGWRGGRHGKHIRCIREGRG